MDNRLLAKFLSGGWAAGWAAGWAIGLIACAPKVQVQAPEEPITINLNIKIEHEIRVKVDNDLEDLFSDDEELF